MDVAENARRAAERHRLLREVQGQVISRALYGSVEELEAALAALRTHYQEHRLIGRGHDRDQPAPPDPCSRCGQETIYNAWGDQEGTELHLSFGYGSRFDLDLWQLTLCDACCQALKDFVSAGPGPGLRRFDYLSRSWVDEG